MININPEKEEAQNRLKIMREHLYQMSHIVLKLHRLDFSYVAVMPISDIVGRAQSVVDLCPMRIYKRDYEYVAWALTLTEEYRKQVEEMAVQLRSTRAKVTP